MEWRNLPCTRSVMHQSIHPHPQIPRSGEHITSCPSGKCNATHCNRIKSPLTRFRIMISTLKRNPKRDEKVRTGCKRWDAEANSFGVAHTRLGDATHRSFRLYHRHKTIVYFSMVQKWTIFNSELNNSHTSDARADRRVSALHSLSSL